MALQNEFLACRQKNKYKSLYYWDPSHANILSCHTDLRAGKNMVGPLYDLAPKASSPNDASNESAKSSSEIVVAIVASDGAVHQKIVGLLSTLNIQFSFYSSGHSLEKSHQLQRTHCLIIETELDDMLGVSLFKHLLAAKHGVPPTIFITVRPGSTAEAVEAMSLGAVDYIEQPFFAHQLISSLERALAA
jgi:CheY-like chemotaxis protein